MTKRWWGIAPAVLVLAGALVLGAGVGAQNSTVTEDDLGMVAEIHTGTCANLSTDIAFPLGSLTRTGAATLGSSSSTNTGFASLGSGLVGASDTTPVWTVTKTIDTAPASLFGGSQSYAIVVGEQGTSGAVAACGDLGGVVANGQIAVAMLPVTSTSSGVLTGIAVFSEPRTLTVATNEATHTPEAGTTTERTDVTVYVFRLAAATTPATGVASPIPATPTVEPTSTPTETATAVETATEVSTGTAEPTVSGTGTAQPTAEATTPAATSTSEAGMTPTP